MTTGTLEQGRELYRQQAWSDCYDQLARCDRESPLEGADLELLATVAYLSGHDAASDDTWARAYRFHVERGNPLRAARCAFWLAFGLLNRDESARAGGWLGRAAQLVEEYGEECVEQGYLLLPGALTDVRSGNPAAGYDTAIVAVRLADRYHDPDLGTLARMVAGTARVDMGAPQAGFALLDEAMVAVTAGEVVPSVSGLAYCRVIDACQEMFDVRRAREWTVALTHWCEAQPDLVPYRGQCLVHRSQIMQLDGSWSDALTEVRRACDRLADTFTAGVAYYQLGELHRLRGEFTQAEDAYRTANQWGHQPEPGLALLRLAQGQTSAAESGVRRLLAEVAPGRGRAAVLDACVEVLLAAKQVGEARTAAEELREMADGVDVPLLSALAAQAGGAVLLAEGSAAEALALLRRSWRIWRELETPYQGARVRLLLGTAFRELGDEDAAQMELDSARWVFDRLGAVPDLARVEALAGTPAPRTTSVLTVREVEVLRLVAAGRTNREVAGELFLSEKTVARHLSNIYAKLDISSRAAATAYAYDHDLL